jgi:3-phytase/alkaline phosphatase D
VEHLEDRLVPTVTFLGVAAGDATSTDVILWTRTQDSAAVPNQTTGYVPGISVNLTALVSTDPAFGSGLSYNGTTDPNLDYTIHLDATGLQSGTNYYYEFMTPDGSSISQEGTFKTAPASTAQVAVHSGFTGDADGLLRPYDATSNVTAPGVTSFANQNFNYFVWLGDTIYETGSGSTSTDNISPAVPSSSTASNLTDGGLAAMEQAYFAKYQQQLKPVNTGSYPGLGDTSSGLQGFFDSTGHYTLLDNHELGNKQLINGGAPPGSNPPGIGVDATNPANDVNSTGTYINQTPAFKALVQAYTAYQPIRIQTVNAPGDTRSNGTQQLYFQQQWGANSIFFNLDDRSYRDIRLKTSSGADDTGVRADNPGRTMLGQTELNWVEQGLLAAQNNGTTWKIVAISSPIDQIGPIGGSFTITNAAGTYSNTESDGGKSWMGAYRVERNALLKFIADNHIDHVIFETTDDHQVRINELGYFTQFDQNGTPIQSSYTRVPGAFEVLVGPIGATGPDAITDHSIANIQSLAQSFASQQIALGIDPIGLDPNFPGLENVSREGDPNADTNRSPFDFYSPDTFNFAVLDVDSTGQHLTVTVNGINSYAQNSFPQPNANNPLRQIMQFTIGLEPVRVTVPQVSAASGGTTTLSATLIDTNTNTPLVGKSLVFSLGGQVIGTGTTDSTGTATLSNVSVAGFPNGLNSGAVTVRFAGDTTDLSGNGVGSLIVNDVTSQLTVDRSGPVFTRSAGTSTVGLYVSNPAIASGSTIQGAFGIVISSLSSSIALQSATVVVNKVTVTLNVTQDSFGNIVINVPKSVAVGLAPGQALPQIKLVFKNSSNRRFDFSTDVFSDPLAS